jgi:hypothetical protein
VPEGEMTPVGWADRQVDPRLDSRQSPQLKATLPHVHLDCFIWVGRNVGSGLERESKVEEEVRCETEERFRVWCLCEGCYHFHRSPPIEISLVSTYFFAFTSTLSTFLTFHLKSYSYAPIKVCA